MEKFKVLLLNSLPIILIALILAIVLLVLYKRGKKDLVRKIVLDLVVKAEKMLGSGTGELKYVNVINAFYFSGRIPKLIRLLFSEKDIDNYIKAGVAKIKKLLSDGNTLLGYDDEKIFENIDDDTGIK